MTPSLVYRVWSLDGMGGATVEYHGESFTAASDMFSILAGVDRIWERSEDNRHWENVVTVTYGGEGIPWERSH